MCCRSNVSVVDHDALRFVMENGLFKPTSSGWERNIPEENMRVDVSIVENYVTFGLWPSISTYSQHEGKRISAAVLFEVASKYAMAVNGEVVQRGLVQGCRPSGAGDVVIASYPHRHLAYDNICDGFRAVILGQHIEPDEDDERRTIAY